MRRTLVISFSVLSLVLLGCGILGAGGLPPVAQPGGSWAPAPVTSEIVEASERSDLVLPVSAVPTDAPTETATLVVEATLTPTRVPTRTPAPTVVPTSPVAEAAGSAEVVITEVDISRAIASGIASQEGLEAVGLDVRFAGGKTHISADQVAYGPLRLQSLSMVGQLVVRDGVLQFDTESLSPGGLVTALIPEMANQALRQYTAGWNIEEVRTEDGQVVLLVS